ncbi:tetratricopeptide repeat protein [Lentibacillus salinarum]|uniref:Tetratricopeptide repeat protein n=1 Tax=Lentibacillus salinarum TaxID=446820 RepID=A0ABW3ZVA0_9BACI
MDNSPENVILFPKWRQALEEESLLALKNKKYEEALEKLDQLLGFGVHNHEINIGRLMCLMELNRYKEAQDFCEALLIHNDNHYDQYVHIYLTILFQTSQYELLMEQVEQEFAAKTVPKDMTDQFRQLYDMSKRMRDEIRTEKTPGYIDDLFQAVETENHVRQYTLVEQIRKLTANPTDRMASLLTDDRVHPVTKTAIFMWLQENGFSEKVLVHKLGAELSVAPDQVSPLTTHPVMQQTLLSINEQEQENPTLFQLMEQLLWHYLYVRYPLMPHENDVNSIAAALTVIGENYLDIHKTKQTDRNEQIIQYMDEIKMCDALYATIREG